MRLSSNAYGTDKQTSFSIAGTLENALEQEQDCPLQLCAEILDLSSVWLIPPPLNNRHLKTEAVRIAADRLLLNFAGVDDRISARDLVGRDVLVHRSDVPDNLLAALDKCQSASFDEGSFGLGLEVHSDSHGHLGTVTEVIETGANLVWVVTGDNYGEVLLPVIDDCILDIDENAGAATVVVMKGLINED
ncbi:MAG: 16S rRNA processing protein RimM [Coriobacteriia bacterium]|nr:16S rRNA processing protein RimM [Coriobacteriia bacterium]MCL2746152.1 16S rRNA processing protein RimM [Coriobacteriia bacterium]MCL2870173.1 16S rRNA processing protein RimM [Coriobacteriia bacterium]